MVSQNNPEIVRESARQVNATACLTKADIANRSSRPCSDLPLTATHDLTLPRKVLLYRCDIGRAKQEGPLRREQQRLSHYEGSDQILKWQQCFNRDAHALFESARPPAVYRPKLIRFDILNLNGIAERTVAVGSHLRVLKQFVSSSSVAHTKRPVHIDIVGFVQSEHVGCQSHVNLFVSLLFSVPACSRTRADLHAEILALCHQLLVLQRSNRGHNLRLGVADRALWVWLSRLSIEWRSALIILKPETVIEWHRKDFPLYWRWKSRHPAGCPVV